MPNGGEAREYVTLPQPPDDAILDTLLTVSSDASLHAERGHDAAGCPRVVIAVAHPDPEVVARTRQHLLRACLGRGVRAFVV